VWLGSKLSGKLPLQLILIVPFVVQLFVVAALVGYASFRNGQKAVNDLAHQLTRKTSELVDQRLDSYLATPHHITQATVDAITLELLETHNLEAIQRFLWKQSQSANVTYINYGLSTGEYIGAGYLDGKIANTVSETSARTNWKNHNYTVDAQGRPLKLIAVYDDYDHRSEGWFQDTMQAKRPIWSSVYNWDGSLDVISIAASQPIYDRLHRLIGAVSVDLMLSDISKFLQTLNLSSAGRILIVEQDGSVIASSGQELPFKLVNQEAQRLQAIDSQDPLIREVAQQLQTRFGSLKAIQRDQQFELSVDRERHFVRVTPWQDGLGLNWLVIVTVPESDFMAQINANTRITVFLCIAALLIAILLGLWTTRWITRPIHQLNRASRAIASGELQQTIEVNSVRELSSLAHAFNQMAQQLRQSFSALEETNAQLETRVDERTADLKAALLHLQQTQAQLVQTEKMSSLGQLVAGVAHELNNPVNFIHGNLTHIAQYTQDLLRLIQLYQHYFPDPPPAIRAESNAIDLCFIQDDLAKVLQSIQSGTARIREIVLSLRNFSRLDEAEFKRVDIHEGIDSTLLILQSRLKAKAGRPEIQVHKHYGSLPLVECYPGQLNQVLMNLLTNAIDALEETLPLLQATAAPSHALSNNEILGGSSPSCSLPTITIRTELLASDWISIGIADNGPGISPQVQARLFDPFFTTKSVGKGTGLGLSISYQIITETHRGRLSCHSMVGQGAEFVIEIPVWQRKEQF
jgi:signal transduction histidine kinase